VEFAGFLRRKQLLPPGQPGTAASADPGPPGEILETAPRHEKALEALLGSHLQGVASRPGPRRRRPWPTCSAPAHVVAPPWLGPMPSGEGTWAGRAVRGPPGPRRRSPTSPTAVKPHVEGMALDLVRAPEGSHPGNQILADAVIVST